MSAAAQAASVTWTLETDGVATLTITNPPMNLVSRAILAALDSTLAAIAANPAVRTLVVTGAGTRAFSAGADIREFPEFANAASPVDAVRLGQATFQRLADLPLPTIAAIEGLALGGGLELALACDLRLASSEARLGLPETGLGVLPCYGGTQRLPRLIGVGPAAYLILTGRLVDAAEALRLGLITHQCEPGTSLALATEVATALAQRSSAALAAAKRLLAQSMNLPLAAGLDQELLVAADLFRGPDLAEGVAAFIGKRPAVFPTRRP